MVGTMGHAKLVERANKIWGKEKWEEKWGLGFRV